MRPQKFLQTAPQRPAPFPMYQAERLRETRKDRTIEPLFDERLRFGEAVSANVELARRGPGRRELRFPGRGGHTRLGRRPRTANEFGLGDDEAHRAETDRGRISIVLDDRPLLIE